jgi:hypothetical protein
VCSCPLPLRVPSPSSSVSCPSLAQKESYVGLSLPATRFCFPVLAVTIGDSCLHLSSHHCHRDGNQLYATVSLRLVTETDTARSLHLGRRIQISCQQNTQFIQLRHHHLPNVRASHNVSQVEKHR